jgi:hypothetical protein
MSRKTDIPKPPPLPPLENPSSLNFSKESTLYKEPSIQRNSLKRFDYIDFEKQSGEYIGTYEKTNSDDEINEFIVVDDD